MRISDWSSDVCSSDLIVQDGPGDCPLCGMALEPMGVPTGEEGPNPELVDFTRRFWVGAALTLPVFLLAMAPHVGLPLRDWLGERAAVWLELILSRSEEHTSELQ